MTELPGRPARSDASQRPESFQTYFLLILGIAFVGAGISTIDFGVYSVGIIGAGAGAQVAAGLISILLFLRSIGSSVPQRTNMKGAARSRHINVNHRSYWSC
jgi:hypothetical protein